MAKSSKTLASETSPATLKTIEPGPATDRHRRFREKLVLSETEIVCRTRLGGLLKHYERNAA